MIILGRYLFDWKTLLNIPSKKKAKSLSRTSSFLSDYFQLIYPCLTMSYLTIPVKFCPAIFGICPTACPAMFDICPNTAGFTTAPGLTPI